MPVAFVKGKLGPNFWERPDLPMGWVTVGIMRDGQGWDYCCSFILTGWSGRPFKRY